MDEKKSWYDYKREWTRMDLIKFGWMCSIPVVGWAALIWSMIFKPHDIKGKWK